MESADTYNLIITRRNGSEILFLPTGSGLELPRVDIEPQRRISEQLTNEVKGKWAIDAYCLSFFTFNQKGNNRCAVMESTRDGDEPSTGGTCWIPRSSGAGEEVHECRFISRVFETFDAYVKSENIDPFARPGWLRELFLWISEQIKPAGLHLTGNFRQLNAGPSFSLLRLETNSGAVWFKATGEPNSHELPVTVAIAKLLPRFVPPVLGVNRKWNGWLALEAAGTSLDEIKDHVAWERVAKTLAELQIASIGTEAELLKARLKDLRIPTLATRIGPFIARMSELMAAQPKPTPPPLAEMELRELGVRLKEACVLLENLHLPDSLGHFDFSPGNILVSGTGCTFLDWAEASITNPLITFEYLCEHMRQRAFPGEGNCERLTKAYLQPWIARGLGDDFKQALSLSPFLAVFACAVANDAWRLVNPQSPAQAGYLRSLTRRMYRKSIEAVTRSSLCLN